MDGPRKLWMKPPFAIQIGLSSDGKWTYEGKRLRRAGWLWKNKQGNRYLTLWFFSAAIWLVYAAPIQNCSES